jgi:hypothetical protein
MTMRIGKTQRSVLRCLRDRKGWSRGAGWAWGTSCGTERIMQRLVEKGLASVRPTKGFLGVTRDHYEITDAGRQALEE